MNFIKIISCLVVTAGIFTVQAQEIIIDNQKEELTNSMITFIDLQQKQLASDLDSIKENFDPNLEITAEDLGILRRLKSVSKEVPLAFNSQVRSYIDKYSSKNYRPYMNRLLGLSKHYFTIYDQVFEEMGIPLEIKYLSLVESSLNPHLVSTSGAVGPWQFMYATAKFYNLEMNSAIDERKDSYAASYAVAQYIKEAYVQFDDWLLALASYNCGRGCVKRAIQRSGLANPSFWELSPFLPNETRNYIPKYIAMTYVMSHSDYYGIESESTELELTNKIVMIDRKVDLNNVANAIGLSKEQLKVYNPAFKQDIIAASAEKPRRLLLPITENINDSLLYSALHEGPVNNREELIVEKPVNMNLVKNIKSATAKKKSSIIVYTVKKGDSLDRIANRFDGSTVSKLKADNKLKSNLIKPGMKLKINKG